ncbi:sarcosine oxidase subunit beta family protein [Mesorhizobium huakuii]|uniref:sarcosine oxidase subunit beta family protein n=1 Tax=Mesorhizobium huakuii TaxID=28104 RepID=UPI003D794A8C
MKKYSVFAIAREAMRGHKGWEEQWSSPEPKKEYDVIIVGAGGHGLATAYYLATVHGITNVAVLEKGWLGGGNTGRNTTIIRSNYLYDESAGIYDHALKLWDGLSQELNYNVMYSARGVMMLAHNVHDIQVLKRHVHANRLNGIDNEWLSPEQAKEFCPPLNISRDARYPVVGAALQRRGGTARHDAVAWGYARGASARGVHIIQNCEVTGVKRAPNGAVMGVDTTRGFIGAKKVGVVAAGHSSVIMNMAGVRMPLESYPLQALVSEPIKPVVPCVVMSNTVHAYISQSDKGELVIGAGTDQYVSLFADRRSAHIAAYARRHLRDVPDLHAHEDAALLGRHCRRDARPLADPGQDAGARPLRQLRLGHGRLQGDARFGPCLCPHHRQGRSASDQRALHHRALPHRPPDRRGGGGGGGALMAVERLSNQPAIGHGEL